MKKLAGLFALAAMLMVGAKYSSAASSPNEYSLRATSCFSPEGFSTVSISWSTAPSILPISGYAYGIAYANSMSTITSDTVGSEVRSATASIPCPAFGDSVVLLGAVRAIDSMGREGDIGSDTLTLRTFIPNPPGAPEVSLDTIAMLTGEGRVIYDELNVVMGDSIQLCYYVEYVDGTLGLDPDIPFCRALAGIPMDFSIRYVSYWGGQNPPM